MARCGPSEKYCASSHCPATGQQGPGGRSDDVPLMTSLHVEPETNKNIYIQGTRNARGCADRALQLVKRRICKHQAGFKQTKQGSKKPISIKNIKYQQGEEQSRVTNNSGSSSEEQPQARGWLLGSAQAKQAARPAGQRAGRARPPSACHLG